MMDRTIGDVIRDLRVSSGLDQKRAAAEAGLSAQYWGDIEHGRRIPPPETLKTLADMFRIDVGALLWTWMRHQAGDEMTNAMWRAVGSTESAPEAELSRKADDFQQQVMAFQSAIAEDIRALCRAVGEFDGARPESPQVVMIICTERAQRLRDAVSQAHDLAYIVSADVMTADTEKRFILRDFARKWIRDHGALTA